ncbi:MAG: IucA/IucC family protein [Pseudonocardiaceae bacterium]
MVGIRLGYETVAERGALAALRSFHPDLATNFGSAVRQARAMALGKLWVALSRERIAGLVPLAHDGLAGILLPDGTRLSAPPAITHAFAQHPAGLTVTRHAAFPQRIDHPVALLTAVLAARPIRAGTDRWLQLSAELDSSVANHALALVGESWRRDRLTRERARGNWATGDNALRWAAQRAAADPSFSPLALFEQAVVDGHPLHPCARVRGGMNVHELFSYTPEWADEVAVRIVAIARSSLTQSSFTRRGLTDELRRWHPEAVDAAEAHLRDVRRDPAGYELLPVHPWQLRRGLPGRCAGALADGRVIVIPRAQIRARPLLSLRTLAPAVDRRAAHIKTSVDIRLTTAIRVVSPATVRNGPIISALLAEISRREHGFGGRLISLTELASGNYRPAPGEPAEAAASLGAIIRESPERHAGERELALPVAALAARSPLTGQPLLADVLDELAFTHGHSRSEAAKFFLARYCDCLVPALLTLLSRWGVALEPHGQNAIVVLRDGLPARLLYRDFGSIRVSPARLARSGVRPPALVDALSTDDDDGLRAALFFPLIDTNLGQVVAALARVGETEPTRLWRLVARCCRSAYATLTADPAITVQAGCDEAALFGPTLPAKSMLRVQLSADPHVPQWVAVPNPLAAAG